MAQEGAQKDRRFFNEEMETMPLEQMRELQLKKLKRQLRYCYDRSDFYREKFRQAGATPEDIKTLDDFRRLPIFLTKDVHRRSQEESREKLGHPFGMFVCAPLESVIGVHSTSGTTGLPTFYLFTRHDIDVNDELCARMLWRMGVRPGDSMLYALGFSMWAAGLYISGIRRLGARPVPVGSEVGADRILQIADLTRPTAMVGTVSLVEHLIERAPRAIGKEARALGIQRILAGAEPGAGLPEVRKKIEEGYGAKLFDGMGPIHQIAIMQCDAPGYQGMHNASPDYHLLMEDLVDPETKQPIEIKDGVVGEAVLTTLELDAAPVIKYGMGDLHQVFTEPCPCGTPGWRTKIVGRSDDMLIVKGVNVYPTAIQNMVNAFVPRVTGEMRIVVDQPPPRVVPPLKLKIEHGRDVGEGELAQLKVEMESKIHDSLRVRPSIQFVPPNALERTVGKKKLLERAY